ncbi:MAG: glycosyltransferase [Plesiomonas sp.]|uniref:glycosyltransferase n=1 Tax=Plesiomonas sp. TaxID=2486279 RepID=UPI003F360240
MKENTLSVSIVNYRSNLSMLKKTLSTLNIAAHVSKLSSILYVVEHSPSFAEMLKVEDVLPCWSAPYKSIVDATNPGFGSGHNRALHSDTKYHLILNPDLEVAPDALQKALEFMNNNPQCGLLTPYATWADGQVQRLCKRYPTVFDLLLRGFAPNMVKRIFQKRLSLYEMGDALNSTDVYWDPPIVSGCFMLFRTEVLKQLGGFDPRFFLYFEDFDISLRTAKISRIAYVPQVKVVHHGGHASRKGWKHIKMFGRSMVTFFNIHGWRWW